MITILKRFSLLACTILFVNIIFIDNVSALTEEAYFAGGCFWCLEHDFEEIQGVISVESGYSGGTNLNPTYEDHEGHQEAISINYNPKVVSYEELLRAYWRNIDPLDGKGQFCDRGISYIPKIFTLTPDQNELAKMSKEYASRELNQSLTSIKVDIEPFKRFWQAEDYHQNFAKNNSLKYNFYRFSCGRDLRLEEIWNNKARKMLPWAL